MVAVAGGQGLEAQELDFVEVAAAEVVAVGVVDEVGLEVMSFWVGEAGLCPLLRKGSFPVVVAAAVLPLAPGGEGHCLIWSWCWSLVLEGHTRGTSWVGHQGWSL